MTKTTQQVQMTEEQRQYLNRLRESGVTNMFGAAPYVAAVFNISKRDARVVLSQWMESFGKEGA